MLTENKDAIPAKPAPMQFLLAEQERLAREGWKYCLGYLIFGTVPFIYIDFYAYDRDALYVLFALLSWVLGYVLFAGVMKDSGYLPEGKQTGIGTYFALGIAAYGLVTTCDRSVEGEFSDLDE